MFSLWTNLKHLTMTTPKCMFVLHDSIPWMPHSMMSQSKVITLNYTNGWHYDSNRVTCRSPAPISILIHWNCTKQALLMNCTINWLLSVSYETTSKLQCNLTYATHHLPQGHPLLLAFCTFADQSWCWARLLHILLRFQNKLSTYNWAVY